MIAELATVQTHVLLQLDRTLEVTGLSFPHYTEHGRWMTNTDGDWTGGMWVGQLWIAYGWSADLRYRDAALALLPALERIIGDSKANFDLGFLLVPSFVRGYQILGDERLRRVALLGATRLLDFVHEKSGLVYIVYANRSAREGRAIASSPIDIMMNLSLLWWAFQETGETKFHEAAFRHAERAAQWLVRSDGSTFHSLDFDVQTGLVVHRGTLHGYSDSSTWARGQAWAIHGFAMAHRATGNAMFGETAHSLSQYFNGRLPDDARSYWDLSDPAIPKVSRDTSASVIAATAWLDMGGEWSSRGRWVVDTLACHSLMRPDSYGILAGATAYKTQGRGIHCATVWGDYFLMNGLSKLTNNKDKKSVTI